MTSTLQAPSMVQPVMSSSDSLLISLFAATVFHIFLILALNFSLPDPKKVNKPIEITLASSPTKKAPKKAKFLAQENQLAAGKKTKKPRPTKQKTASMGKRKKNLPVQHKAQPKSQPKVSKKLITQEQAEEKIATKEKPAPPSSQKSPKLTADALKKQISQLGAEIRHSNQTSEKTKIKFVNSVSTHKGVAIQYKRDWEEKVERIGNMNFPEAAKKKDFSSSLTMDVGINADGSIAGISIIKSSGNKALDDAAKRIVMLSAPFPALPVELLKELDVLRIRRVWNFSDESGISSN